MPALLFLFGCPFLTRDAHLARLVLGIASEMQAFGRWKSNSAVTHQRAVWSQSMLQGVLNCLHCQQAFAVTAAVSGALVKLVDKMWLPESSPATACTMAGTNGACPCKCCRPGSQHWSLRVPLCFQIRRPHCWPTAWSCCPPTTRQPRSE